MDFMHRYHDINKLMNVVSTHVQYGSTVNCYAPTTSIIQYLCFGQASRHIS